MNAQRYEYMLAAFQIDGDVFFRHSPSTIDLLGESGWSVAGVFPESNHDGFNYTLLMQRPAPLTAEPLCGDDAKLLLPYKKALEAISLLPFVTEESPWMWSDISKEQTRIARLALEDGVAPSYKPSEPIVESSFSVYCPVCGRETLHQVNNADRNLVTCNVCDDTHTDIPF